MAFEIMKNDLKIFILVLVGIPLIATTNIDCSGKSFHCVNSTHFMICVDLGGGISTTVDTFVIPCPPPTVCQGTNYFECEFPVSTTLTPTVQPIVATNETEPTTLAWEHIYTTDSTIMGVEQHLELSTVRNIQEVITDSAVTYPDYVIGNDSGLLNVLQSSIDATELIDTTDSRDRFVNELIKTSEPPTLLTTSEDIISSTVANETESTTVTESTTGNVTEPTIEIFYGHSTDNVSSSDMNETELMTTIYNVIAPVTPLGSSVTNVPNSNIAVTDTGSEKTTEIVFTDVSYYGEPTTDVTESPMIDVNTEYVTQTLNEIMSPIDSVNLTVIVTDNVTISSIIETTDGKVGQQLNFSIPSIDDVTDSVVINVTEIPDNNIDLSKIITNNTQDDIIDKEPVTKGNDNNQYITELNVENITELSTISVTRDIVSGTEFTLENSTESALVFEPFIKENNAINKTIQEVSATNVTDQSYENKSDIFTTTLDAYSTTESGNTITIEPTIRNNVLDYTSENIRETIVVDNTNPATESFNVSTLETTVTNYAALENLGHITENYNSSSNAISTVTLVNNNTSPDGNVQIPTQVIMESTSFNPNNNESANIEINTANIGIAEENYISYTTFYIESVNPTTPDTLTGISTTEKTNLLDIENQYSKTTIDDNILHDIEKSTVVYNATDFTTDSIKSESTTVNNNVQVNSETQTQSLWNNYYTLEYNENGTIVNNKSSETTSNKVLDSGSNSENKRPEESVTRGNNVTIAIETTQTPQVITTTVTNSTNQIPITFPDTSQIASNGYQHNISSDNKFEPEAIQGIYDTATSITLEKITIGKAITSDFSTDAVTDVIGYNTLTDDVTTPYTTSITEANIELELNINPSNVNISGTELPGNGILSYANEEGTTRVDFGLDATGINYGQTSAYDETSLSLYQTETDATTPLSLQETEGLGESTQLNSANISKINIPVNQVTTSATNLKQNFTTSVNDGYVATSTYSTSSLTETSSKQESMNQQNRESTLLETKTQSFIDITSHSISTSPSTYLSGVSNTIANHGSLTESEITISSSTPIEISSLHNFNDNVMDLRKNNTINETNESETTLTTFITESYHKAADITNSVVSENLLSGIQVTTVTGNAKIDVTQSMPSSTEHISTSQTNFLENVLFQETVSNPQFILTTPSYFNENVDSARSTLNILSDRNSTSKPVNVPNDYPTTPLNRDSNTTEITNMGLDRPEKVLDSNIKQGNSEFAKSPDLKKIGDATVSTLQISDSYLSHISSLVEFPRTTNKEMLENTEDGILLSTFSTAIPIKTNSTEFVDQVNIVTTVKNVAMNNLNISFNTKNDITTDIQDKTSLTSTAQGENSNKNINDDSTTPMIESTFVQNSNPKDMVTSISGTFLPDFSSGKNFTSSLPIAKISEEQQKTLINKKDDLSQDPKNSEILNPENKKIEIEDPSNFNREQSTQATDFISLTETTTPDSDGISFSELATEEVITSSNRLLSSTTTERSTIPEPIHKQVTPYFDCQAHPRGRYSDQHDCRKFYICNGTPHTIVGMCPSNTVFSEMKKLCTKNLSHCIRENQFHCVSQGRFSDFKEPNVYYICVKKGGAFLRYKLQCQNGFHLNKTTVRCYQNTESSSVSISNDNSQSIAEKKKPKRKNKRDRFECEKEGKFAHSNDCRKYYVCTRSDRSEEFSIRIKKCDSDEVFHKKKRRCVDESSYECS